MTTAAELASYASSFPSFRNRIINGDMRIDQRNAGAVVTVNNATTFYPVDRFYGYGHSADGVFTLQQSSTAPSGFLYSIVATVTTADASVGATQIYNLSYRVEGNDVADLGWGTADAKTVTLSFWVRSSLTGTFSGSLSNSAYNYSYPFNYTISSADTWEKKTITIAGATSGTWVTNNGIGMRVYWSIGTGSNDLGTAGSWTSSGKSGATGETSIIGTLNATFYITGVQLEVGTVATPFEHRPYGTELALCQRYYEAPPDGDAGSIIFGVSAVTGTHRGTYSFKQSKRAKPTIVGSISGSVLSISTDYVVIQRTNDNAEISGMKVSAEL